MPLHGRINIPYRFGWDFATLAPVKDPRDILKQYWGYDVFRPSQEKIIHAVLEGRDTLALLPTGGGKSICFQVPAMCREGVCLVISPLIALMQDQVNNLRKKGIEAHAVMSSLGKREIDRILDNAIYGQVKFLYVSPERLQNELFLERFRRMKISLIAVDESHCISQWGYDFRPEYLRIADIRQLKPEVPVLALTASATPLVVEDIQNKLAFKDRHVIGSGFGRANLSYNVSHQEDKEKKLIEICKKMPGSGVVYCGTRLRTRELDDLLKKNGISSAYYHAGLTVSEKEQAFKRWMKNEARIMCATNAFGMGIDKPDVRFVIHADIPAQPEAYFQEAGRAGRDGQMAYGVLLWHESDILRMRDQIAKKYPDKEIIRKIYRQLCSFLQIPPGSGNGVTYPLDLTAFARTFDQQPSTCLYALQILQLAGYLHLDDTSFMGSRLHMLMNKQDLYSYQVANPGIDNFIRTILRMYGGLFENYVQIREADLAKAAAMSVQQTRDKLIILHKQGVVDYLEHSDLPQVTFLTARFHEDALLFSPEVYEDRKKHEVERAQFMEYFLTATKCRSVLLLEYFGEKNTRACGICDVCRGKMKKGLDPDLELNLDETIRDLMLQREFTLDELPQLLPRFPAHVITEFVRRKVDEGSYVITDRFILTLAALSDDQD